mmetsp:Transcript_7958/g.18589  ORF Transcript_7958/g.18589 Transcript_7958/m.18589 type:complete len:256 (-) Transcript_7958:159-926(-)
MSGHLHSLDQSNPLSLRTAGTARSKRRYTSSSVVSAPFPSLVTSTLLASALYPTMLRFLALSNAILRHSLTSSIRISRTMRSWSATASTSPSIGLRLPLHPMRTASTILTQCEQVMPSMSMRTSPAVRPPRPVPASPGRQTTTGVTLTSPYLLGSAGALGGAGPDPDERPRWASCVAALDTCWTRPGMSTRPGTHFPRTSNWGRLAGACDGGRSIPPLLGRDEWTPPLSASCRRCAAWRRSRGVMPSTPFGGGPC